MNMMRDYAVHESASKVPQVTVVFWLVKIAATTLGETGGDAVSMSWLGETTSRADGTGYLIATGLFALVFAVAVAAQIRAARFHPLLYWFAIVASTTVGTTLADYVTRSLGIGYSGGSALLLALVVASLAAWKRTLGTVAVDSVSDPKSEAFYWLTIGFAHRAVLGRLHPDPSAGRGARRLPRQAAGEGRTGTEPHERVAGTARVHRRLPRRASVAGGAAPALTRTGGCRGHRRFTGEPQRSGNGHHTRRRGADACGGRQAPGALDYNIAASACGSVFSSFRLKPAAISLALPTSAALPCCLPSI